MNNEQKLEKLTDYVEDKDINEQHLSTALSDLTGKIGKTSKVDYKIDEKHIEIIMKEFLYDKNKATKFLKQAKGDLKEALHLIIES